MGTANRPYEKTHPWLTFSLDMRDVSPKLWMALGEVQSKCEHLAGAALKPSIAARLHGIYMAKGIMATAAIEGNTLSEEEVEKRIGGDLPLPPSKEYLGIEIDNVLAAANGIIRHVMDGDGAPIKKDDILSYNKQILENLVVEDHVTPGEIRKTAVGVSGYRGAPAEDCDYLMDRLCFWLASEDFRAEKGYEIVYGIIKAIVAHIYIAWIHPFGDGNGRTARMLEVRILLESGAPSDAAQLLSNHYNETRHEYYRVLDLISKNGGNIKPFIEYAVNGIRDQLREQIEIVRSEQLKATWQNYVHEKFKDQKSPVDRRRRLLVLAVSETLDPTPISNLRRLTPELAELYAGKTMKMILRDVDNVVGMGLLLKKDRAVMPNAKIIAAFLPDRKEIS